MKGSKLVEIMREGNLVIPIYLLKKYKDLKLELDEFIYLMYLYNQGNRFTFDPNLFAGALNRDLSEIMEFTNQLTDKGFITVEVFENEKGFMEEIVVLDNFYNKIKYYMMDEVNQDEVKEIEGSTIYEVIENEFARTLSSIEFEIIKAWLESGFSEEIIKEALKEAVLNGVSNLKYIDKILYEWNKKGIKTVKDVEKNRKKRNALMEKNKEVDKNLDLDIMDWDWFDEDE